jgi:hypothetical protein
MSQARTPLDLLISWLKGRLGEPARAWVEERAALLAAAPLDRDLAIAFGLAPRKVGKADLALDERELARAAEARPGWDPRDWSVDQAARLAFLLAHGGADPQGLHRRIEDLFATADVGEQVCLFRGLPLYPQPALYRTRAREGARTNMRTVFEAVAHRNPYPAEEFDQNAWNHMVLKALFVGSSLHPIQGLDARANQELATMLCDYAHERWAAGRPVSPELWRCVGRFADERAIADLERVLAKGSATERQAAALALCACPKEEAGRLVEREAPELAARIRGGEMSWRTLMAASGQEER